MNKFDALDGMSAAEIIAEFGLEPLAGEGGYFAPLQREPEGNSIYFLLAANDFSAWHRLKERETWVLLAGDPIDLHILEDRKAQLDYQLHILNRSGASLSHSVNPGEWMAATTQGQWSLILCFLAPAFSGMELASSQLFHSWHETLPQIPELIHEK